MQSLPTDTSLLSPKGRVAITWLDRHPQQILLDRRHMPGQHKTSALSWCLAHARKHLVSRTSSGRQRGVTWSEAGACLSM